jgi:hypothetical protein
MDWQVRWYSGGGWWAALMRMLRQQDGASAQVEAMQTEPHSGPVMVIPA